MRLLLATLILVLVGLGLWLGIGWIGRARGKSTSVVKSLRAAALLPYVLIAIMVILFPVRLGVRGLPLFFFVVGVLLLGMVSSLSWTWRKNIPWTKTPDTPPRDGPAA